MEKFRQVLTAHTVSSCGENLFSAVSLDFAEPSSSTNDTCLVFFFFSNLILIFNITILCF